MLKTFPEAPRSPGSSGPPDLFGQGPLETSLCGPSALAASLAVSPGTGTHLAILHVSVGLYPAGRDC